MSENNKAPENGNNKHERGRPHEGRRAEIEKEIRSYFIRGLSPPLVAVQTGHNIKTIRYYYRIFSSFRRSLNESGFNQECKINIESVLAAIDNKISKLDELYDLQKKYLDTFGLELSINSGIGELRKIIKTTSELYALKLAIANSPTADIHLMKMAQGVLEKFGSPLAN